MVIDDSRAMRVILRKLMTQAGFTVSEAGDGLEALAVLEGCEEAPALALIDWNMPNMDGLEFVKAVGANRLFSEVFLMRVTREGEHSEMGRALPAGAHEYVIKPFTADSIAEKLELLGLVPLELTA